MINIFKIRKEERWLALGVFLYTLMLNVLVIIKYYDRFSKLSKNYRSLFVKTFHISGYDPLPPLSASRRAIRTASSSTSTSTTASGSGVSRT